MFEEKIANGWIHSRIMLEVEGNDKEHVHKALQEVCEKLKSEKGISVFKETFDSVKELRPGWFNLNVELELLVKGVDRFVYLVTSYPPVSLEILAPQDIACPASELQSALLGIAGYVNTLSNALHLHVRKVQKAEAEQEKLRQEFQKLKR